MANVVAYARWLKEQRESVEPKLTRAQLAQLAGVSHTYIHKLEKAAEGESSATIQEPAEARIDAISQVLGRFLGRPMINEARRALGYPSTNEDVEAEAVARGALPPLRLRPLTMPRITDSEDLLQVFAKWHEYILGLPLEHRRALSEAVRAIERDERLREAAEGELRRVELGAAFAGLGQAAV